MSGTSALFSDVWQNVEDRVVSEPTVEPRQSPVATPVRDEIDYREMIEELNREMMQRSQMFIIAIMIVVVVLLQRIHRLERRLGGPLRY